MGYSLGLVSYRNIFIAGLGRGADMHAAPGQRGGYQHAGGQLRPAKFRLAGALMTRSLPTVMMQVVRIRIRDAPAVPATMQPPASNAASKSRHCF
jgi:hypothetical protein